MTIYQYDDTMIYYQIIVGNSLSVSQSPTLDRKDKVKHYIRIKAHNNIALRFWCKSGV